MERGSRAVKKKSPPIILFILLFCVAAGAAAGAFFFFEGEIPKITVKETPDFIGSGYELHFTVTDAKSGLRSIKVVMRQDKKEKELFADAYPRAGYTGKIGPAEESKSILIEPRKLGFADGPAEIEIEARDYSLRGVFAGNLGLFKKVITIDTVPPKIDLLHSERAIKPGGSAIAIYRVSPDTVTDGAQINGSFSPGFPAGGEKQDVHVVYFALPYDTVKIDAAQVVARDRAGNKAVVSLPLSLQRSVQKADQITIDDAFLNAKLPEFEQHYPEMAKLSGDNKEKYLYVNNTIRLENNKKILAVCQAPSPDRLWQGRFLRMPGSPRAGFADHRTYLYKGDPFDKQVHLGVDIAQTERTEVKAANKGKVVMAEYLGIYGNTIILDHGQGIFSLYSHLSEFLTTVGETVAEGTVIARTGHTGMAGGDHLHFSMLVHGIFVTPIEWWDPHWISVTIDEPLREAKAK